MTQKLRDCSPIPLPKDGYISVVPLWKYLRLFKTNRCAAV